MTPPKMRAPAERLKVVVPAALVPVRILKVVALIVAATIRCDSAPTHGAPAVPTRLFCVLASAPAVLSWNSATLSAEVLLLLA